MRRYSTSGLRGCGLIEGCGQFRLARVCSLNLSLFFPFLLKVKVRLPVNLKKTHHLLFTFYHISCDLHKSGKASKASTKLPPVETPGEWVGLMLLIKLVTLLSNADIFT